MAAVQIANATAVNLAAAQEPGEVCAILKDALQDGMITALAALAGWKSPNTIPEWFITAAIKPIGETFRDVDGAMRQRIEAMNLIVAEISSQIVERVKATP